MIWDMIIGNDKYFNIGNEIFNFEYIMIEGREVNSEYLLETKTIDL